MPEPSAQPATPHPFRPRLVQALLILTALSPLVWLDLVTARLMADLLLALVAGALWILASRRGAHRAEAVALLAVFGIAILWTDGIALWLRDPAARWWHGLPAALLTVTVIASRWASGAPTRALPSVPLALLWGALGLWALMHLASIPVNFLAKLWIAVVLLALPVTVPRALTPRLGKAVGAALLLAAVALIGAGLVTGQRIGHLLEEAAQNPEEWFSLTTADDLTRLEQLHRRFPANGEEATIAALQAMVAFEAGEAAEAQAIIERALADHEEPNPALTTASCLILGASGDLEGLLTRVDTGEVIASGSIEAAREFAAALAMAERFDNVAALEQRFGLDLFAEGHPRLTPLRIAKSLIAMGDPAEALAWLTGEEPPATHAAEWLFWQGHAHAMLGEDLEAVRLWRFALTHAPSHGDARAHLNDVAGALRVGEPLTSLPVAGRHLLSVEAQGDGGETVDTLEPGQRIAIVCVWRLVDLVDEPTRLTLRLGDQHVPLEDVTPTAQLATGEDFQIGATVRTSTVTRIPATLPSGAVWAQLIVEREGSHSELVGLAALRAPSGFREHDQRDPSQGISAASRHRLFGADSVALGVGTALSSAESALHHLDEPIRGAQLGIISHLSGARRVNDGQVVAQVLVSDQRGRIEAFPLTAGRDTADIWHEYPGFEGDIDHSLGEVAWQMPRVYEGTEFPLTFSLGEFEFAEPMDVAAIEIDATLTPGPVLHIVDLVVVPPAAE